MKYPIIPFLICLLIIFLSSCFIQINSDNSESAKDSPFINTIDSSGLSHSSTNQDTIIFYEVNAEKLKALKDEEFVIYIWADWCKPCIEKMPELVKYSKENNDRILFVNLEYYFANTYKILSKNGFSGNAYILDSHEYSKNIWQKLTNFKKEICDLCDMEEKSGVPSIYFVDSKDQTRIFHSGSLSSSEVDSMFNLIL